VLSKLSADLPTPVWQVPCQVTHHYGTYPFGVVMRNSLKIVDSVMSSLFILYLVILKHVVRPLNGVLKWLPVTHKIVACSCFGERKVGAHREVCVCVCVCVCEAF
jgi:hypothetical protein